MYDLQDSPSRCAILSLVLSERDALFCSTQKKYEAHANKHTFQRNTRKSALHNTPHGLATLASGLSRMSYGTFKSEPIKCAGVLVCVCVNMQIMFGSRANSPTARAHQRPYNNG